MNPDGKRITEAQLRRELTRFDDHTARRRAGKAAVVILAVALLAGILAARFLFVAMDIRTDGMLPTLAGGDVAVILRRDAPFLERDVERGALVLVRYAESGMQRQALRRLVALGGDEVSVQDDGQVTLNGEALEEPYATYSTQDDLPIDEILPGGALENPFASADAPAQAPSPALRPAEGIDDLDYPLTVPEGAAFVLCDNRDNRLDSRSSRFGLVAEADIQGVALAILWPAYRAGPLDGRPVG